MSLRSSVITAAAFVSLSAGVFAQAAGTPSKVGVISINGAIAGTKDGQKATAELETKFSPKKKEFDSRQNEIVQLQDQLTKSGSVMSEEKRTQMAREIDEKKKRLERDAQDAQEDFQGEQQKLLQNLGSRMMAILEKYAKDNGYTLILDVGNQNTPVLYAASAIDITPDIIALYDKSPAPAAPTAAPKTPGTVK
jgi:outer membrane protein